MTKKYTLTQDYGTSPDAKAGTVVYRLAKSDYGLARDDTDATGIPHVSVTLNPDGDYPSFTVPSTFLQEEGIQEGVDAFGGRRYAGIIVNARPFVEQWPRCICGFLAGRDHKGRGFDNGPIRTSLVERLLINDGKLYAITMNSAYQLDTVDLMAFLKCPEWFDDIDNLITQAVVPASEGGVA